MAGPVGSPAKKQKAPVKADSPRWLAASPSKRWGELFFLGYSPVWVGILAAVVATGSYEDFTGAHYLALTIGIAVPCFVFPLLFPGEADAKLPIVERYWFKANVYMCIYSFIGNHFYTHYFYNVLGAQYSMPGPRLNDVPLLTHFATVPYFHLYHSWSNMMLRRYYTSRSYSLVGCAVVVFAMAYFTAFMETFTIEKFPYYSFTVDRMLVYKVGSIFYGIYFMVSYPMFIRLDEEPKDRWTVSRTAIDALGCCMAIFTLLDIWRLSVGTLPGVVPRACVPFA